MSNNSDNKRRLSLDYYSKPYKMVRDLSLGYVYLTRFDIDIIDTISFQRLKDIRQLTCQQVYPSARHTRFEHSLGVMELTRRVIDSLNKNKYISESTDESVLFDENIQFNAGIAALLHDVGHCPFSHLGESEFDREEILKELLDVINENDILKNSELRKSINEAGLKISSAMHEMISCLIILDKYKEMFDDVNNKKITYNDKGNQLSIDLEFIMRCILGMPYDVSTVKKIELYKKNNIIISLINSKIFDMDKLDYIMRDSYFSGIGTPRIDLDRLFKNIHIRSKNVFKIVFSSKAVQSLQNMIESRDLLYMYVYNHHLSVYSDFMLSYIFRRLSHNQIDFIDFIKNFLISKKINIDNIDDYYEDITALGLVKKEYIFSLNSILGYNRSDSDIISLLNILNQTTLDSTNINQYICGYINDITRIKYSTFAKWLDKHNNEANLIYSNYKRVHILINNYLNRNYLSPWWKTNSEFNRFINKFDDSIRTTLCKYICTGIDNSHVCSDEFCSQLAKNVSFIVNKLYLIKRTVNEYNINIIEPLGQDGFFIIKRSTNFFKLEKIQDLEIAQRKNEILSSLNDISESTDDVYSYIPLTHVIPQRNYDEIYESNSFYIFSKSVKNNYTENRKKDHYKQIENIFIFVAKQMVIGGEAWFNERYTDKIKEKDSYEDMLKKYINSIKK